MQKLLKPTDVADRLSVSRAWVYDAAKVGRIPAIRIGGEDGPLRFVAEDVERWIDDARAAWTPGGPTVPTGHLAVLSRKRRSRATRPRQALADGQQSLI